MKYIKHNQQLTEEDRKYRYLYFCLLNTKLVYVGASHLLESRLRDHRFPFNEYRFIKGKTNQVNKWEKKLIRKYKPINNSSELPKDGRWFKEDGDLNYYHNSKITSQPIFPKVNSKYKDPKYNKSYYYRRNYERISVYKIIKSKRDRLWAEMEHCSKPVMVEFIKQSNGSYKMERRKYVHR
jgi:hypothetical protein